MFGRGAKNVLQHFLVLILCLLGLGLFYERFAEINLTRYSQVLQFGRPRLVQHRSHVDVQRRTLTIRHLADVAFVRLLIVVITD